MSVLNLPPETLDQICSYLVLNQVRNFSRVNKNFRASCQRALFHTLHLKVNLESFEHLMSISDHTTLRTYVRRIEYDGRTVEGNEFSGFQYWLENFAGVGFGMPEDLTKNYLKAFDEPTLESFYRAHCQYVHGLEYLRDGHHAKDFLRPALARFSNLSNISYSAIEHKRSGLGETPSWESLGTVAKKILQEPMGKIDEYGEDWDLWPFIETCLHTNVFDKLQELSLNQMDIQDWKQHLPILSVVFAVMRNLRHLVLNFCPSDPREAAGTLDITDCLASLSLSTLAISFARPFDEIDPFARLSGPSSSAIFSAPSCLQDHKTELAGTYCLFTSSPPSSPSRYMLMRNTDSDIMV